MANRIAGTPSLAELVTQAETELQKERLRHTMDAMQHATASVAPTPLPRPLGQYTNSELVMEMIRRGYAVMKLPKDGGPPETLR